MKIWGHSYFLLLTAAAAYFYQERMINFDSAHYTFHILQKHDFFIKHDRWVNYLTQWIPLLAKELNCSLRTILILYSGGLMALIYLVYLLIAQVLKNKEAALLMVFVFGALYREKFYAGVSEILPAIAFGILYIAFFTKDSEQRRPYPNINYLWHAFFGLLLAISHPVPAFPLLGLYFFWLAYQNRLFQWENWLKIFAFCLPLLIKYLNIPKGSYESRKMSLLENAPEVLANPENYHVSSIMLDYFQNEHWVAWALFFISLIYILSKRKYLAALIVLSTVLATFLLNYITFSYLRTDTLLMIDGYMMFLGLPLGFIVCMILSKSAFKHLIYPLLIVFFCFNLYRIWNARSFFQERLSLIEESINRHSDGDTRLLISGYHQVQWDKLWLPYQIPSESVLLSTLKKGRDSTAFIIVERMHQRQNIVSELNNMSFIKKTDHLEFLRYFNKNKYPKAMFYLPADSKAAYVDRPAWLSDKIIEETNNWIRVKHGVEIK